MNCSVSHKKIPQLQGGSVADTCTVTIAAELSAPKGGPKCRGLLRRARDAHEVDAVPIALRVWKVRSQCRAALGHHLAVLAYGAVTADADGTAID